MWRFRGTPSPFQVNNVKLELKSAQCSRICGLSSRLPPLGRTAYLQCMRNTGHRDRPSISLVTPPNTNSTTSPNRYAPITIESAPMTSTSYRRRAATCSFRSVLRWRTSQTRPIPDINRTASSASWAISRSLTDRMLIFSAACSHGPDRLMARRAWGLDFQAIAIWRPNGANTGARLGMNNTGRPLLNSAA